MDFSVTIEFYDEVAQDKACVIIRNVSGRVAICLSLMSDGDVEVSLTSDQVDQVIEALRKASS